LSTRNDGPDSTTHFGFRHVDTDEKARLVKGVFDSVAARYDLMNDLMSGGVHRLWKRFAAAMTGIRPGDTVLDVAAGSGDLTARLSQQVGPRGMVVAADINAAMLEVGRDRLTNRGLCGNVAFVQANAERLPFAANHFACATIAFGLRNVTDKAAALRSLYAVLKPGGKMLVLEFSKPVTPALAKVYDWYSFNVLPKLGRTFAHDEASYRYLAESIRMHPSQEDMKDMMRQAGFERCEYLNLSAGIVALHTGYKF